MDYKFSGLELTPNIFRELLLQLFDGKQFSRQEAISKIKQYHFEHGGLLGKASYTSVFKKAAQKLKNNGMVNIEYGVWRLNYEVETTEIVPSEKKKVQKA